MRLISSVAVDAWEAMLDTYCCCMAKTWRCSVSGVSGAAGGWEHGDSTAAAAGDVAMMLEMGELEATAPKSGNAWGTRACAAGDA